MSLPASFETLNSYLPLLLQLTFNMVKLNKSVENDTAAPFNKLRELIVVFCSYVHILFLICTGGLAITISNLNTTDIPNGTETELAGATKREKINATLSPFK